MCWLRQRRNDQKQHEMAVGRVLLDRRKGASEKTRPTYEGAIDMAEVTQQQVVEYIKGISVLELSQLVKTLESELGVSAAAAMPMMAMPGAAGGGAAAPAEEQTEFTVTLTE